MLKAFILCNDTVLKEGLKSNLKESSVQVNFIDGNKIDYLLKKSCQNSFDLIFIDTAFFDALEEVSAKEIIRKHKNAQIIFIIDSINSLRMLLELANVKYISKPLNKRELMTMIQSILKKNTSELEKIPCLPKLAVYKGAEIYLIHIAEIVYIYAENNKVTVVMDKNQTFSSRHTLNQWEKILCKSGFFRCHRGYIVNILKVTRIEPYFNSTYMLYFCKDIKGIPVGRNYLKDFKDIVSL